MSLKKIFTDFRPGTALNGILLFYFLMLAAHGREFSYFHLNLGFMPLYVGEMALGLSLICFLFFCKVESWRSYWGFFVFLGIGIFQTVFSLVQYSGNGEVLQVLRDSALWYQALWFLWATRLKASQRQRLWTCLLIGLGLAGFSDYLVQFLGIPGLAGNETVSPAFPLGFALFPGWLGILYPALFGVLFSGYVVFYLKKSWAISNLVIFLPLSLLVGSKEISLKRTLKRGSAYFTFLSVAIVISFFSNWVADRRIGDENEAVRMQTESSKGISSGRKASPIDDNFITHNLKKTMLYRNGTDDWVFHGELYRDSVGSVITVIGWRQHLWKQVIAGWRQNPWFGRGFGPRMYMTDVTGGRAVGPDGKWISGPHNSYLTILFRMGLVGLFGFCFFCVPVVMRSFSRMLNQVRGGNFLGALNFATFLSIAFFTFFNVSLENPQSGIWFWVFLGILVAEQRENGTEIATEV